MADHEIALEKLAGQLVSETYKHEIQHGKRLKTQLWQLRKTQQHVTSPIPNVGTGNNWAVLVETSKYWYNYRHAANASGLRNGGCWSHFDEAGKTKEIREKKW